jgi:hypothetical protein
MIALLASVALPAWAQADTAADDDAAKSTGDAPTRQERRDPSDWRDWRNYQPSISGGFGVTFDHLDSSLQGINRWRPGGAIPECSFPGDPTPETCVRVESSFDGFIQGGAFNLGGRVTLPEFDVPSKPQIFANASWGRQRQGQQALAYAGIPSEFWGSSQDFLGGVGQDKFLRVEQTIEPKSVLFVGLGASFMLPIQDYPVRINATVNYYRSSAEVGARYDFLPSPNNTDPGFNSDQFVSESLITHGIAPGIGIDAVLGENRFFEFGFYTDFFVGFPLSDNTYTQTLTNGYAPPSGYAGDEEKFDFYFDRDVNYSVFIGLRLSLARD